MISWLTNEMNFWLHHLTNQLKCGDEARKLMQDELEEMEKREPAGTD